MTEETDNKKEERYSSSSNTQKPLLSRGEIVDEVKGFIYAFRNGDVELELHDAPLPTELRRQFECILNQSSRYGRKKDELREKISEMVAICSGTKKATEGEIYDVMNTLYNTIVYLRAYNRLNGKFYGSNLREEVKRLSEDLDALSTRMSNIEDELSSDGNGQ